MSQGVLVMTNLEGPCLIVIFIGACVFSVGGCIIALQQSMFVFYTVAICKMATKKNIEKL